MGEVELEKIPLLIIYKQGKDITIQRDPEASKFEIFGALYNYLELLKKEFEHEWRPKK